MTKQSLLGLLLWGFPCPRLAHGSVSKSLTHSAEPEFLNQLFTECEEAPRLERLSAVEFG